MLAMSRLMTPSGRRARPKVKGHAGKVAITRGPLVYCLESPDNLNLDIFTPQLDPASVRDEFVSDLLGGTCCHPRQKHCQQATEIPSVFPLGEPGQAPNDRLG